MHLYFGYCYLWLVLWPRVTYDSCKLEFGSVPHRNLYAYELYRLIFLVLVGTRQSYTIVKLFSSKCTPLEVMKAWVSKCDKMFKNVTIPSNRAVFWFQFQFVWEAFQSNELTDWIVSVLLRCCVQRETVWVVSLSSVTRLLAPVCCLKGWELGSSLRMRQKPHWGVKSREATQTSILTPSLHHWSPASVCARERV